MEILRSNFDTSLPFLLESIRTCDFIAWDTEFTGLSADAQDQTNHYDTLEARYLKVRRVCQKFWACQLGICTFTHEAGSIKARPFNLYLLPYAKEQSIIASPSSMSFLAEHNFNFGTLFTEGLYCVKAEDLLSVIDLVQRPEETNEMFQLSHSHAA